LFFPSRYLLSLRLEDYAGFSNSHVYAKHRQRISMLQLVFSDGRWAEHAPRQSCEDVHRMFCAAAAIRREKVVDEPGTT
jgi:hypothetical protein